MMIFSLWEIIQISITVLAVGFIFSGHFKKPRYSLNDIVEAYKGPFNWQDIKYAALITSPAIILHEFSHKFVALGYGLDAVYNMSYWGLGLGIALRMFGSGFIFFLPGFVSISGLANYFQMSTIALAGPLTNLILFSLSYGLLKSNKWPQWNHAFSLSKTINLWLFIFNMLPIPGFDGFAFYRGLFGLLF